MFSKSCEYGLRAVIYIADESLNGNKSSLIKISNAIDSPTAFTSKILQQLTKSNIVKSIKGPNGGFLIENDTMNTKLSEIVTLIDGDKIFKGCGLGLKNCDSNAPCPLHDEFVAIRVKLEKLLNNNTLESIISSIDKDKLLLKR